MPPQESVSWSTRVPQPWKTWGHGLELLLNAAATVGWQGQRTCRGSAGLVVAIEAPMGLSAPGCMCCCSLYVDAIRLQHDARLQDALIFSSPMNDRRQDDEDD